MMGVQTVLNLIPTLLYVRLLATIRKLYIQNLFKKKASFVMKRRSDRVLYCSLLLSHNMRSHLLRFIVLFQSFSDFLRFSISRIYDIRIWR